MPSFDMINAGAAFFTRQAIENISLPFNALSITVVTYYKV